jgi:hypothetical protein
MNCFQHPEVPAVGVCRACGRAACPDCVAPELSSIACASGTCAERVIALDRMLDLNLKLMPRTERLAATAERMSGAGERIQAVIFGTGRTVYLFNYAIGIGAFLGGTVVAWKGIEWKVYVISLLGGLLALIGAALTLVGARVRRAYRRDQSPTAETLSR